MRSSIRQVAELAQVSPITVSRVLRGRKNLLREETYERVVAALHELNYVQVHTTTQRHAVETNVIGVVPVQRKLSHQSLDGLTFEGICSAASSHDYDLFIMLRSEAEWMANREELRFLDRRSDGFIFISPNLGEWQTSLQSLVQHEIPAVVCYRRDVPDGVAWVDPDNEEIIRIAVECLKKHGHDNIAYLGAPVRSQANEGALANLSQARTNYDDTERQRYFLELMRERHGAQDNSAQDNSAQDNSAQDNSAQAGPTIVHIDNLDWRVEASHLQAILDAGVTGVICVSDLLALALWDAAERAGLRIPADLSIISVDNQPHAASRGLTSIDFGYDQVGSLAVEAWIALREGQSAASCCKVVPVRLEERDSVGPPRAAPKQP